jgi:hypothetical protein
MCAIRARAAIQVEKIRDLPVLTERGAQIRLADVAAITVMDGPPMLRSENARLSGWVYVDIRGRDLKSAVTDMQRAVAKAVIIGPGYSVSWSGQFEYLERATAKLKVVVPATLVIIFVLLYLTFGRVDEALLIMASLPFALIGGCWLLFLLGHNLSVASAVGFIALAGVSAEFGVIMLLYFEARMGCASGGRRGADARPAGGRDPRRRGFARAAEGDDRRGNHRRPPAYHVRQRHGLGNHAAYRSAHGGRDANGAAAVDVRDTSRVPVDAPAARKRRDNRHYQEPDWSRVDQWLRIANRNCSSVSAARLRF